MKTNLILGVFFTMFTLIMTSCGDDLESSSFDYSFNSAYTGTHANDLQATLTVEELEAGGSMITVELTNTVDGETYAMHAHDAADAATTPNSTPYDEMPNSSIFAQQLVGNGGNATISQETTMSYSELTNNYEGFFVVHDPLQAINTAATETFLVVDAFAR